MDATPTPAPTRRADEVLFVESAAPGARAALGALAAAHAARLDCELLEGAADPGLYLLVCRGDGEALASVDAPPGARLWRFRPAGRGAGGR